MIKIRCLKVPWFTKLKWSIWKSRNERPLTKSGATWIKESMAQSGSKNGFSRTMVQFRAKCPLLWPAFILSKSAIIKAQLLNKRVGAILTKPIF